MISHNKTRCTICFNDLVGKQRKFCSKQCKSTYHQNSVIQNQRKRGLQRKIYLIKKAGGKCKSCGYSKNLSALSFHHILPSKKSFPLDLRSLSNRSMSKIESEFLKCELLCLNCHTELHHPEFDNTSSSLL